MGPIPGGNDTVLEVPGLGTLGTMTSLDRATYVYEDTNGYDLEVRNIPRGWGDLRVEQYRLDAQHDRDLVGSFLVERRRRDHTSVRVSGAWSPGTSGAQQLPPPIGQRGPTPEEPEPSVAQGVDLIVIRSAR